MKKAFYIAAVATLLTSGVGIAGAIKTWSTSETLKSADINGNFSHIHSTMVGGHGARLVNSDVSASAAIAHSKLATPSLLPQAWAQWKTTCTSGTTPCAPAAAVGVTDMVWNSSGDYAVRLSVGRINTNYLVLVTPYGAASSTLYCGAYNLGTGTTLGSFGVQCRDAAGTLTDASFGVLVMDNDT